MVTFDTNRNANCTPVSVQEIPVQIRNARELGTPLFDDFVSVCSKGLPGFTHRTKGEVTHLFNSRGTVDTDSLNSLRTPRVDLGSAYYLHNAKRPSASSYEIANLRSRIPLRATLLSFDTTVTYPQLEQYLHKTTQQLAPMEALLSMLLTNCHVTPGYEVKGPTGKVHVAGDCKLKIAGIESSSSPTFISDGGLIRDGGSLDERPRSSLFGARLTSEKFEFFLPFRHRESGFGWPPGTLFVVEARR